MTLADEPSPISCVSAEAAEWPLQRQPDPVRASSGARPRAGLRPKFGEWTRRLAASAFVPLRSMLGSRVREACGILMYHRVAPLSRGVPTPTYNVTPECFRRQLAGLLAKGYQAWPLRQVLESSRTGKPIPRNAFVVTFDDGYENNYTEAWPILKELGIPATIFLATSYLDGNSPFPFDVWSHAGAADVAPDSWRPLSTRQCAEMLACGSIELGSHTHTHQNFRGRADALRNDVLQSLEALRTRFGLADATFAFPFGIHDSEMIGAVRQTGALCSLTTANELVLPGTDPFRWGRFAATGSDTASTLAAKLDGWYSLARDVWLSVRRRKSTT